MLLAIEKVGIRNSEGNLSVITPGNEIKGLSGSDEQSLITSGAAERVEYVKIDEKIDNGPINYFKILDEEFNAADLKETAKEAGLDFPGNISKENLIKQIIEEGKVEDIIDIQEED